MFLLKSVLVFVFAFVFVSLPISFLGRDNIAFRPLSFSLVVVHFAHIFGADGYNYPPGAAITH